jgi:hypothetical protein
VPVPSHRPHRDPGRKPEIKHATGGVVADETPATVEFETPAGRGGMWGAPSSPTKTVVADEADEAPTMPLTFPLTTGPGRTS